MTSDAQLLLARILGVLGATAMVGCASRSTNNDVAESEAGSGTESGAEAETSTEASTTDPETGESESEETEESESEETDEGETETETDTDDPKFDISTSGDGDGDGECSGLFPDYRNQYPLPGSCTTPEFYSSSTICYIPVDGFGCDEPPYSDACLLDAYGCGLIEGGEGISCGPIETNGACCYLVWGDCAVGRPWIVDGQARQAKLREGGASDWASPIELDVRELDSATRAALADVWTREGLAEHASVASFARFTKQLLALAAPPALIHASARAAVDEVAHAKACFALASAYAGRAISPGSLDIRGGLDGHQDLIAIALSLAAEGCIAETVSAILIAAARDRARDPALRATLATIARDELDHVLLAWDALAWICGRARALGLTELRPQLLAVFCDAERHVGLGVTTPLADPLDLRAHGYLSIDERRTIAARALTEVVGPAARELMNGMSYSARSSVTRI